MLLKCLLNLRHFENEQYKNICYTYHLLQIKVQKYIAFKVYELYNHV